MRQRPVEQIELNESRPKLRLVLVIALIAVAVIAFGYSIWRWRQIDPGWTEIEYTGGVPQSVAPELKLNYELEKGTSTQTFRALSALYNELSIRAYKVFDPHASYGTDGITGLGSVLQRAGEVITVDEALYEAFEILQEADSRLLYLGPVYEVYDSLFHSLSDAEAAEVDPFANSDSAAFCRRAAAFASDPEMIDLELLGDNRVCLHVAEEYRSFAEENESYALLDFFWMRNAFAVDYIADHLTESGFTRGSVTSRDGFARCMDASGNTYATTIYERNGNKISEKGELAYDEPAAVVYLRDYPLAPATDDYYYEYEDGSIRTPYVDAADGLCRNSIHELLGCARGGSCAEVLTAIAPLYIGEDFDAAAADGLAAQGIETIYADS